MVKFVKIFIKFVSYISCKILKLSRFSYKLFEITALGILLKAIPILGWLEITYKSDSESCKYIYLATSQLSIIQTPKCLQLHSHQPAGEKTLHNGSCSRKSCFNQLWLTYFTVIYDPVKNSPDLRWTCAREQPWSLSLINFSVNPPRWTAVIHDVSFPEQKQADLLPTSLCFLRSCWLLRVCPAVRPLQHFRKCVSWSLDLYCPMCSF